MDIIVREEIFHKTNRYGDSVSYSIYFQVKLEDNGKRFLSAQGFDSYEEAEKATIQDDDWRETNPVYGSAAHQAIGDYHLMDEQELSRAHY